MTQDVLGLLSGLPKELERLEIRLAALEARLDPGQGRKGEEFAEWERMVELARGRVEALIERHLGLEDAAPDLPASTGGLHQVLRTRSLDDPEDLFDVWKELTILAEWAGRWSSALLDMEDSVDFEMDRANGDGWSLREISRLIRSVTRKPPA
jgi:hypothetical protein